MKNWKCQELLQLYQYIESNISPETHIGLGVSDQEVPVLAALRHECVTVAAADLAVVPALTSYLLTHRLVPENPQINNKEERKI
jgi:hypothetical protein